MYKLLEIVFAEATHVQTIRSSIC